MAAPDESARIGKNVRAARKQTGKSQEVIAGLVGKSPSWLSLVESGKILLDKRSDIAALATALDVAATDLLGGPAPMMPFGPGQLIPTQLREVLLDSSLDDPPDLPTRPLDVLAAEWVGPILAARQRSRHEELARLLPPTIAELHFHAASAGGSDRESALRLLVDVCGVATFILRHNGFVDLAWIAADRAERAAYALGEDVWLGAAQFAKAHSRSSADRSRALRTAAAMADRIEPQLDHDRTAHEVYGMLRLSAALDAMVAGDQERADDQAAEAARVAARTGEHADAWQWFGPSNVGTWRTMLAVEAGEPSRALDHARQVVPRALPNKGRRASLAIETARAHAMMGDVNTAAVHLRRAEKLSAARTHNNPFVRDLVMDMRESSRRDAGGRDLRILAEHMGIH